MYLFLRCLDHVPPLESPDESGQHDYDLPQIRTDIKNREEVIRAYNDDKFSEDRIHFRRVTGRFLAAHPHCRIGIRDEYGREHSIIPPVPEPQNVGAVVEAHLAADGLPPTRQIWVRLASRSLNTCWAGPVGGTWSWDALLDPLVLHEGWTP